MNRIDIVLRLIVRILRCAYYKSNVEACTDMSGSMRTAQFC